MTNHLRGLAVRTEGKAVTFLASTDTDQASDGLVISKDAWDISRFLKTGAPVMWSHRYDLPPIGTASNVRVTDQGLVMDVAFDETSGDDLARTIAAKVRSGVINACSVGFDVIEQVGAKVKKARLIELSIVSIGADPNAIALARSAYRGSKTDNDWWSQPAGITRRPAKRTSPSLSKDERLAAMFMALPKERQERVFRTFTESEKDRLIRAIKTARQSDTVLVVHGRFLNTLADVAKEKGLLR